MVACRRRCTPVSSLVIGSEKQRGKKKRERAAAAERERALDLGHGRGCGAPFMQAKAAAGPWWRWVAELPRSLLSAWRKVEDGNGEERAAVGWTPLGS